MCSPLRREHLSLSFRVTDCKVTLRRATWDPLGQGPGLFLRRGHETGPLRPASLLQPPARQEEQTRVVRQFHFHGWPEVGIPADGKGMIDLIAAVQKQQQQTGDHPIAVHCR